jgi:uncharacterized spore protein YtfJ
MKFDEFVTTARDAITVRRVFGGPVTENGATVIPVASVWGGGGGSGGGHYQQGQQGQGGGFGVHARPVGAYVIKDGVVRWMPAVDTKRIVNLLGALMIACRFRRVRMTRLRAKAGGTSE